MDKSSNISSDDGDRKEEHKITINDHNLDQQIKYLKNNPTREEEEEGKEEDSQLDPYGLGFLGPYKDTTTDHKREPNYSHDEITTE